MPAEPNIGDVYGVQSTWVARSDGPTEFSRFTRRKIFSYFATTSNRRQPRSGAIYQDALWKVCKNGYPRAWLTHQTVVQPSEDAVFARLDKPGIDLHNVAVLERRCRALDAAATGGSIRFESYDPESMSTEISMWR